MSPHAAILDPMPTPGRAVRLGSITRRLVYTVALFPIVAIAAPTAHEFLHDQLRLKWFDELRCLNSLVAVLWVTGILVIWHGAVAWTPRRKWLTALACLIPFLQVIYGRAWWTPPSTGWLDVRSSVMRIGQGQIGIGAWLWLTTWIWWGRENAAMQSHAKEHQEGSARIGRMGRRLVVCFAMLPLQIGCYILLYLALESSLGPRTEVPVSMSIMAIVSVAAWIMIWRRAVAWSRKTVRQTIWLTLALLVLPLGAEFLYTSGLAEGLVIALTLIGWSAWMMATIRIWPMAVVVDAENTTTPRCLRCGYLLTGLTSTRCPECGDEPTIDALWHATAGEL